MRTGIRLRVLGPLEVADGPEAVRVPAGRLQALLVSLVMAANQVVPGETLVEQVWWGSDPPARPLGALQTCVMRLRRIIGRDTIATVGAAGYIFTASADSLDLLRFRELVQHSDSAAAEGGTPRELALLREALSLWRGEPFAGTPASWLRDRALARLTDEWFGALMRRIDLELAVGRHRELIPELRDLTVAHPLREATWQRLMTALHRCGRRAEALDTYRRARAILRDELALDPSDQLQRLQRRILEDGAGRPADRVAGREQALPVLAARSGAQLVSARPWRPSPAQLPSDVAGFTGRVPQLAWLTGLLPPGALDPVAEGSVGAPAAQAAAMAISLISGPVGVGKTALAVHWAHLVRAHFPDGQLHADLRGCGPTSLDPLPVLGRFLRALGTPGEAVPTELDEAAALYRSSLAGRRMLVLLDDVGRPEQVRPLFPGSPGCLVLMTSRSRLVELVARDGARRLDLGVLDPHEAHALVTVLLGDRARAEPGAVRDLAMRYGRRPLSLRAAAADLATDPPTQPPPSRSSARAASASGICS
ncbi:MAG: BTAD domain-containing putative transcriptional regulator [Frankia sp.]